ncbi:MAG: hypothetical protein ABIQ16_13960 [Polyangiaceae bacterium]
MTNVTEPTAGDATRPEAHAGLPPVNPAAAPPAPAPPPPALAPPPPIPKSNGARVGEEQTSAPEPQAYFAFGPQIGLYNPNGLTVHIGVPAIAIEATAGFAPLVLSYESPSRNQANVLKFLMPFEVTPQLVIHAVTFRHEMRGNLLLGYRYNRALGNGVTLGGELEGHVSRKVVLQGLWGISYYPDAVDRLRGGRVPPDAAFKFPPWFGYGLSVGLLFYP